MAGSLQIITLILAALAFAAILFVLVRLRSLDAGLSRKHDEAAALNKEGRRDLRDGLQKDIRNAESNLQAENARFRSELEQKDAGMRAAISANSSELRTEIGQKLSEQATQNEQKFENIRTTMEARIRSMQEDNAKQLDLMRQTVDEKLQKTLEDRIGQSFKLVSERLEQVYKGLGEMQALAAGVGDLKKVLTNVKTRGILGEYQLAAILDEILTKDQYETNVRVKRGSRENVEFAIRLPGEGAEPVYLPIDSKFPTEPYQRLIEAQESGDPGAAARAGKELQSAVMKSASDIASKYINPPVTTNFAIMFLPVEGLYAEVVKAGMLEELQNRYSVNIAGPTTMAAVLNSLQMGFHTLAIQKSSNEVARVLGAVKKEFSTFEDVLQKARLNIQQVDRNLETLVGVRTRKINSRLTGITELPEDETRRVLSGAVFEDDGAADPLAYEDPGPMDLAGS